MIAIHAIAAILFLGPATVANSQFHVRAYDAHNGNTQAAGSAKTLFKISQSYGMLSLLVPLLGIAIMLLDWSFYKSEGQFHAAIALSVITWALLLFVIFPRQKKMMGALGLLEDDEQAVHVRRHLGSAVGHHRCADVHLTHLKLPKPPRTFSWWFFAAQIRRLLCCQPSAA